MDKQIFGQNKISKLIAYKKGCKVVVSNNYMTNAYILFTHESLKNKSDLVGTFDNEVFFYDPKLFFKMSKLLKKEHLSRMNDQQIEVAIVPQGHDLHNRTLAIKRTPILIETPTMIIQVWQTEEGEIVFFDYNLLLYFGVKSDMLHGWEPNRIFMDTPTGGFKCGVMPVDSNVFKEDGTLKTELSDIFNTLHDLIK